MTRRVSSERLESLEAARYAYLGLDADLPAHLPAWWRYLADDELGRIARMQSFRPGATLPVDNDERRDYLSINAACRARVGA